MQSKAIKKIFKNGFWLSILLHALLLTALLTLVAIPPKSKEKTLLPNNYVPAYTYTGSIKPSANTPKMQSAQRNENKTTTAKTKISDHSDPKENAANIQSVDNTLSSYEVPKILKKMPQKKTSKLTAQKSLLADSLNMLEDNQLREVSTKQDAEPIYMIGDDSQPADPLIKLLGRSLSAHFGYPRMAGQLGIRGRVLVSFLLHPEGYYTNVQMVQSSQNQDLDAAALYAVNSAPRIEGADRFISKPRHFVVGFIFN